jgi:hypothetical protein
MWVTANSRFEAMTLPAGGVTDHGALTGLDPDDDHTQYTLADGTRTFTTSSINGCVVYDTGNNVIDTTNDYCSVITGGINARLDGNYSAIYGGHTPNIASAAVCSATIGGLGATILGADYSAVVAGEYCAVSADYSATLAGDGNVVSGEASAACAGGNVDVEGFFNGSLGGYTNDVHGYFSAIVGGASCSMGGSTTNCALITASRTCTTANGTSNTIIAGTNNTNITGGSDTAAIGGKSNTVNATSGGIFGGQSCNLNDTLESAIVGGNAIIHDNDKSFSGGGFTINVSGYAAGSLAGRANDVTGSYASCVGGKDITVNGTRAFAIGGGLTTVNNAYASGVVGGYDHDIESTANYATIVGGRTGTIKTGTENSIILGGYNNTVNEDDAAILSGNACTNNGSGAVIAGGERGEIKTGCYCGFIGGGWDNTINSPKSAIIGGRSNETQNFYTAILGGQGNTVLGKYGIVHGKNVHNEHWGCHAYSGGANVDGGLKIVKHLQAGASTNATQLSIDLTLSNDQSTVNTAEHLVQPSYTHWYFRAWIVGITSSGGSGCHGHIYAAISRNAAAAPVIDWSSVVMDHEDDAGFNISLLIRSGNIVTIGTLQPTGWGQCMWCADVQITEVQGGY